MKVSLSLPDGDVEFIDEYARQRKVSRSRAVHEAVTMLRGRGLAADYAAAFGEDVDADWDVTVRDGLT
ncbi:MAG TPA: ribbon-helix-helix domain-containing protein [Actinoplanes sp.]|nr:ribbon-helix-helix domain-containing protein [Actinoplanes sp.]